MRKKPVIHQTDLFQPYNDPDDHWDLACQYALYKSGDIDLKGVVIDYSHTLAYGDPAVMAVHQLNYLTNQAVPVGIGLPNQLGDRDGLEDALHKGQGLSGVTLVLDTLRRSEEPVAIHIVGSCRDIAAATYTEPALFREKCKAIYLCAGAWKHSERLEYNQWVDPYAYRLMYEISCPIYWMPPVDIMVDPPFSATRHSTFYDVEQGEILPYLRKPIQNFFLYALMRSSDLKWLTFLDSPVDPKRLEFFSKSFRNMWNTAGFLHAAGKKVLTTGQMVSLEDSAENQLYRFVPVSVECDEKGVTHWQEDPTSKDHFIFRIEDMDAYPQAMTKALKTLLCTL